LARDRVWIDVTAAAALFQQEIVDQVNEREP